MTSTKRETSRARLVSIRLHGLSRDESVIVVRNVRDALTRESWEVRFAATRMEAAVRYERPMHKTVARDLGGLTAPEFAVFLAALAEAVRAFRPAPAPAPCARKPFETKRIGTGPRACECARCVRGMTDSCERV